MTKDQQRTFADLVRTWYSRSPQAAEASALTTTLLLTQHDEDELAFEDLHLILAMYGIRLTPDEYAFLSEIVHAFPHGPDLELLADLAALTDR